MTYSFFMEANVLIDDSGRPRISNFGLSRTLEDPEDQPSAVAASSFCGWDSLKWLALELLGAQPKVTTGSDVYAFGRYSEHRSLPYSERIEDKHVMSKDFERAIMEGV